MKKKIATILILIFIFTGGFGKDAHAAAIELYSTPLISDANLVYYWRLEGNSNSTVGTNNGVDTSITYSAGNGMFGQGAGFVAANSSKIAFPTLMTGATGTIALWFKTSNTGGQTLFQQSDTASNFRLSIAMSNIFNVGEVSFYIGNNTPANNPLMYCATNVHTYDDNAWHLVSITVDNSGNKVYMDGSPAAVTYGKGSATSTYWFSSITANVMDLGIARYNSSVISKYTGAIDDVSLFNRALTATEVSNLYSGNWPSTSVRKATIINFE